MKFFDEDEAVAFMRSRISDDNLTDDAILDVIDAIYDYYDQNDDLEIDFDEDEDESESDDVASIIEFVNDALSGSGLSESVIEELVKAELAYEQSLL